MVIFEEEYEKSSCLAIAFTASVFKKKPRDYTRFSREPNENLVEICENLWFRERLFVEPGESLETTRGSRNARNDRNETTQRLLAKAQRNGDGVYHGEHRGHRERRRGGGMVDGDF